jgi:hypothetical protein
VTAAPRTEGPVLPRDVVTGLTALLCDADGNLFPSEEPAFVASAEVTNRFLAELADLLLPVLTGGGR